MKLHDRVVNALGHFAYQVSQAQYKRHYAAQRRINELAGVHYIKLQKEFVDPVWSGKKKFEIRFNDRGYQSGDRIRFIPIDENGKELDHPIRDYDYLITYLLSGWGLEAGYVAFAIERQAS